MNDLLFSSLVLLGVFVAGLLLFWPGRGVLAGRRRVSHLSHRANSEDALKYIYKTHSAGRPVTLEGIAGVLHLDRDEVARLLTRMQAAGLVEPGGISGALSAAHWLYLLMALPGVLAVGVSLTLKRVA